MPVPEGTPTPVLMAFLQRVQAELNLRGEEVVKVQREATPCVICGDAIVSIRPEALLCAKCRNEGWRAKTCPSCGERPLHGRDYNSGAYKKDKTLKCGWCRARDNAGPEMLA